MFLKYLYAINFVHYWHADKMYQHTIIAFSQIVNISVNHYFPKLSDISPPLNNSELHMKQAGTVWTRHVARIVKFDSKLARCPHSASPHC